MAHRPHPQGEGGGMGGAWIKERIHFKPTGCQNRGVSDGGSVWARGVGWYQLRPFLMDPLRPTCVRGGVQALSHWLGSPRPTAPDAPFSFIVRWS